MSRRADIDPHCSLVQPAAMFYAALSIVIGLTLVIWSRPISDQMMRKRATRLSDLESGEPETFFEEHRSLKTYRVTTSPQILRLLGTGWIILGVVRIGGGY